LNNTIVDIKLNCFWCEPTLVKQGSQTGLYKLVYSIVKNSDINLYDDK